MDPIRKRRGVTHWQSGYESSKENEQGGIGKLHGAKVMSGMSAGVKERSEGWPSMGMGRLYMPSGETQGTDG